jgi:outer membrane lipopolysaccharide assembly protein LptE/RlpB
MKKLISLLTVTSILLFFTACGNDNKLNKAEEESVENRILQDEQAMDSLEKAIQAQLDKVESEFDSIEKEKE